MKHLASYLGILLLAACQGTPNPNREGTPATGQNDQPDITPKGYMDRVSAVVKLESFDQDRFLESETAFFVDSQVVACRLSAVIHATRIQITPWDESGSYAISGFLAVDRINDLVLLRTDEITRPGIPLADSHAVPGAKTIYLSRPRNNTLPLHKGQLTELGTVKGSKRYRVSNIFQSAAYGTPVFTAPDQCIGLGYSEIEDYDKQNFVIPSVLILDLMRKRSPKPQPLTGLRSSADQATSVANSRIKGLLIETSRGPIRIRLFNETPVYRDNFIALVKENFYDSLLIHRVITGFGIQGGAADTRYAEKDDVVGWKGPGYTLPAHIVPGYFHRRGMVGSPRLPDRENRKRRSDGSQFYIVTGRKYSDAELNEIEEQNNYRFTPRQREVYKTTGGAPHLDGAYTIFGEVTDGLDLADQISQVEVDGNYRPLEDIRIKRITIIP